MPCRLSVLIGNTSRVRLWDVEDDRGEPIVAATAAITLYDENDVEVVGQIGGWPLALAWDSVRKEYSGVLSATLDVERRQFLRGHVTLDGGATFVYEEDVEVVVERRGYP